MQAVDWFRIISDLIYHKVPMRQVQQRCSLKLSENLLRAYRSGTQPLHPRGEALIKLWLEVTKLDAADIPRKEWIPRTGARKG